MKARWSVAGSAHRPLIDSVVLAYHSSTDYMDIYYFDGGVSRGVM